MLKRFFSSLLVGFLLLFLLTPVVALGQEEIPEATPSPTPVSSFELFWPIAAGKVPGEPLYFLKTIKWWVKEKLTFDEIKKADLHLLLSKKSVVEAEKLLLEKKDSQNAEKTLLKAVKEIKISVEIGKMAEANNKPVKDLYNAIQADGQKEIDFLRYLSTQVSEGDKDLVSQTADSITAIINQI